MTSLIRFLSPQNSFFFAPFFFKSSFEKKLFKYLINETYQYNYYQILCISRDTYLTSSSNNILTYFLMKRHTEVRCHMALTGTIILDDALKIENKQYKTFFLFWHQSNQAINCNDRKVSTYYIPPDL
ncbi:hypothetical protein BpHYR1_052407 [Brachionus plicatilis]|uniref:Uncharacterized protein n=1 Tax=Brachionus plicatilis TaxID=10195 RepID=A0A3M7Q4T2_BRAPC|nr:hypothetical protein BpHYR1_052407 [Brachionus plicatilis]